MTNISAYYTIDQVVEETLLTLPESQRNERERRRFLNFAVSGLRYLRSFVTKDGKVREKVTPNSLNRISFPDDMEEFLALYVPVNGKIWKLTRNNEIIPTKTVVGIDESYDEDYGEGVEQPIVELDNFAASNDVNLEGYYTIDYENKEIIINSNRKTELVLEYISNGIGLSSISNVPAKYVKALTAWILWKDVFFDRSVALNIKVLYENEFKKSVREIKSLEAMSLDEVIDAWNNKSILQG
jgi:hypothetical protein